MSSSEDITITIPAAIAALPDLDLIEKTLLARIDESPACHNADLAVLTGLSKRGIQSTLGRLRERDLIQVIGKGRARRLFLRFHVEQHMGCCVANGSAAISSAISLN